MNVTYRETQSHSDPSFSRLNSGGLVKKNFEFKLSVMHFIYELVKIHYPLIHHVDITEILLKGHKI